MSLQFFRGRAAQGGSYTGQRDAPGQASIVSFGATGDGSTDDSAAITAAIESIRAQGGGVVYFPPGTYRAQGLPIYGDVWYVGGGTDTTVVKLINSPTDHLFKHTLNTGVIAYGGFRDLCLDGGGTTTYDGISFAALEYNINAYTVENCVIRYFRNGYVGPSQSGATRSEFNTFISCCVFGGCSGAGLLTYENPYICNNLFNGGVAGSIGISGRLFDTFVCGNAFTQLAYSIKSDATTANGLHWSTVTGNLFYGGLAGGVHIYTDNGTTITGNHFAGLGSSTAMSSAIVVRGNHNVISGNRFGRDDSGALKGDFVDGAISFSATDANGGALSTCGIGTTITGNSFYLKNGPAIKQAASKPHAGMNISGNSFYPVANVRCVDFTNTTPNFTWNNAFTGNTFYLSANTTTPALEIAFSFYGNTITDNAFIVGSGNTCSTLLKLDASNSVVSGNRLYTSATNCQTTPPVNISAKNARTKTMGNLVVDSSGREGVFVEMGLNETRVLGKLIGADFNSTGDQIIYINSTRYVVERVMVCAASISLTTAAGGLYAAPTKFGSPLVASTQTYSALTSAAKWMDCTLAATPGTDMYTASALYLSLTTAQGATATADVYVIGRDLGKS